MRTRTDRCVLLSLPYFKSVVVSASGCVPFSTSVCVPLTRVTHACVPYDTMQKEALSPTIPSDLTSSQPSTACMWMRNLSSGIKITSNDNRDKITVRDVLIWCINKSIINARKLLPIWTNQRIEYQKHLNAWCETSQSKFQNHFLEKESKTIEQHYGLHLSRKDRISSYRKLQ